MAHPLAVKIAHWPPDARDQWAELAGRLQHDGRGCSREESEARAEEMVRAYHERWGEGPVWTARR